MRIIDSTLREGMQARGVCFTAAQGVTIAKYLAALGIDTIECGHPAVSPAEHARVRALADLRLPVPVLAHARATRGDIAAVRSAGADWVGIFCGVNDVTTRARIVGRSTDDLIGLVEDSIGFARSIGLMVRYTVEDGSRTRYGDLLRAYRTAVAAGANRVCFADTVGDLEPSDVRTIVGSLKRDLPGVDLEVHLHDDRGLSTANALAAVDAGADWVSTSVNGLGERCGITDLAVLSANLHRRGQRRLCNADVLQELSTVVAAYARTAPDPLRPVVGTNAFTHTAKLHVRAAQIDESAYSWIDPFALGRTVATVEPPPQQQHPLVNVPLTISATELRHHRAGPGERYVMIDDRFIRDARQYCIVRRIPHLAEYGAGHVDAHVHRCDSLFMFLGFEAHLAGLVVDVTVDGITRRLESPAAVFIPSGVEHSYSVVGGAGLYVNHVLSGTYGASLLEHDALLAAEAVPAGR